MNDLSFPMRRGPARPSPSTRPSVRRTIELTLGASPAPLSWEAIDAVARIVITPDDRPIRTIITGRRRITTGMYSSTKSGRSHPFEGMNEQGFIMHNEVDTRVVDYRAQPFRFEFVIAGAKRIYIADCARLLADGRIEVVEVKNDRRALKDPHYALKLAYVRDICTQLGWDFRVVLKDEIFTPPVVFANVVVVQSRRLVKYDASHAYLAFEHIDRMGGQAPLGRIAETLGERQLGMSIIPAMMVGRLVEIDLSTPLSGDSVVSLVEGSQPAMIEGGVS
jgi:hypothetical protein